MRNTENWVRIVFIACLSTFCKHETLLYFHAYKAASDQRFVLTSLQGSNFYFTENSLWIWLLVWFAERVQIREQHVHRDLIARVLPLLWLSIWFWYWRCQHSTKWRPSATQNWMENISDSTYSFAFGFIEFSKSRILAFFSIYFSLIEYTWDKYAICVEDPFEVDFNLSRNVSQETLHDIIFQFRTAYIDLCGQPDLSILWEKAVFE